MRKRTIPFPIYRLFLHLYPLAYRKQYGDQMVQTLQDMLDDCETSEARLFVWLRVAYETPLSILQENMNNLGENGMKKVVTTSSKRLTLYVGLVLFGILIAGLIFGRGKIMASTANLFYGDTLSTTTLTKNIQLGNPFLVLTGNTPKPVHGCSVNAESGISTEIDCDATLNGYTKLGQSSAEEAKTMASVAAITTELKQQGYQAGTNGVTLTSLVSGTYKGQDWSPDAAYEKVSGQYDCLFDTQIAYSNMSHQQPAIHMSLSCVRTFNVFGKPSSETYQSSKGMIRIY